jgi:hypothetical protein
MSDTYHELLDGVPDTIRLTGLRHLDRETMGRLLGGLLDLGITIAKDNGESHHTAEEEPQDYSINKVDFENVAASLEETSKGTDTKAWNALHRPFVLAQEVKQKKARGLPLSFWDEDRMETEPWKLALVNNNGQLSYNGLRYAFDNHLLDDMRGLGEKCIVLVEAVLKSIDEHRARATNETPDS